MGKWLQKRLDGGKLEAAEYRVQLDGMSGDRTVTLACPCCGETSALDTELYAVAPNGVVSPIWPCPDAGCPASVWILLESWGE